MTSLNDLAKEINKTSTEHGFWPAEGRNFGEMIALAHSELSEALEEHRDGKPPRYYKCKTCGFEATTNDISVHYLPHTGLFGRLFRTIGMTQRFKCDQKEGGLKPEGAAVELADCIIRCLDTLQSLDVDIDEVTREKMAYNDGRPFMHGRKY